MGKSEWIPASIKPEQTGKGIFCLIERNKKLYPETCYYFNKHQQDFSPDGNEDWADFENDEYYLPEGWYTICDQCEKYWKVEPSFYMVGIDYPVSHSPNEPDVLVEGDYCVFENEIQARQNSKHWIIVPQFLEQAIKDSMERGVQFVNGTIYLCHDKDCITQLTAPEFIRRAENTFKKK